MKRVAYGSGAQNADIASTLHDLATVKLNLKDLDGALRLCEESLGMKVSVYGPDAKNASIATSLDSLAAV
eukprot:8310649-Prorocentrum_lima.AAC.1